MTVPHRIPLARRWGLALLLSLALHALTGAVLVIAGRTGATADADSRSIVDTQVRNPRRQGDVELVLDDLPAPLPALPVRIMELAPVAASPAKWTRQPVAPPSTIPTLSGQATAKGPSAGAAASPAAQEASGNVTGSGRALNVLAAGAACKTVVYVIDRSASMGENGGLATAKRELLASLDRLGPGVRFQVILYNRSAEPLAIGGRTDLVPATPENKGQVWRYLAALDAEGATRHEAALHRALVLRPEVIFFLTDADDLGDDQVQDVTRMNQNRTAIHAVRLVRSRRQPDDTPLRALALANRGTYRTLELAP